MPPIIFNVLVDAIVCPLVLVVVPIEAGVEGLGVSIQDLEEFFYFDDGLVMLNQLDRLQMEVEILADLLLNCKFETRTVLPL